MGSKGSSSSASSGLPGCAESQPAASSGYWSAHSIITPRKALSPVVEDTPPPKLDGMTVRVETPGLPDFGTLSEQYDHRLVFSRIMRGDEPGHPGADANGYVKLPNVDSLVEALDMREAQRAYEANLNVIETARAMEMRTLDLLKK